MYKAIIFACVAISSVFVWGVLDWLFFAADTHNVFPILTAFVFFVNAVGWLTFDDTRLPLGITIYGVIISAAIAIINGCIIALATWDAVNAAGSVHYSSSQWDLVWNDGLNIGFWSLVAGLLFLPAWLSEEVGW